MTWVRALSLVPCGAPALLRAASVQVTISAVGICLGGEGKTETFSKNRCLGLCKHFRGQVDYPLV